jgi:DNA-binding NtrC family response regulator
LSIQKPNIFIVQEDDNINAILAGIFWLKGFKPFKFTDGTECLKRFREMYGNIDSVVTSNKIALDNDLMLVANIKRINPTTKVLVITDEESGKRKILEYGADEFALMPLNPIDISHKIILMISKGRLIEDQSDLI